MFQLLLLVISFGYGFLVAVFNYLIGNKNIFKIIYFFIVTLVYVGLFYFINNGNIHLYNKFSLILGYSLYYVLRNVKLNVKFKKKINKT